MIIEITTGECTLTTAK